MYEKQFVSTTAAIMEYIRLYQQFATTRSIPLGIKKTHVGRTDSRTRWEEARAEFTQLLQLFPKSQTEDWYLLICSVQTNMMPEDRRKYLEEVTKKPWTRYAMDRKTNQLYGTITTKLRNRNLLINERRAA